MRICRLYLLLLALALLIACTPKARPTASPSLALPATASPSPVLPSPTAAIPFELRGEHNGAAERVKAAECRAYGWAANANDPEQDLLVRVLADGVEVAQDAADQYRLDLGAFKRCTGGTCAFDFSLAGLITPDQPHQVVVQALDPAGNAWVDLDGSPQTLTCAPGLAGGAAGMPQATPEIIQDSSGRVKFSLGVNYLIVEFLDDDLLHFEYSGVESANDLSQPLPASPMIARHDYPGPSQLLRSDETTFETAALRVRVDPTTLCLTAIDLARQPELTLTTLCPADLGQDGQGISLTPESFTHVYGLGEAFGGPGEADGDWSGRARLPGSVFGNAMLGWNGGGVGNAQFPIAYFAGQGLDSYALFADNPYAQRWDFRRTPWEVELGGSWLRFYLFSGPDLPDLRQDYLELVGQPLVPPKAMFGLWISEYGYDNWAELEDKLGSLRQNNFPVDGFVLDLQWFGGIQGYSDDSPMGSLDWDLQNFPDPAGKIAQLEAEDGLGIMLIEESYISRGLPEHQELAGQGYLARACRTCPPSYLTGNPWWGQGGMVDWTNPAAGAFWHDWKRQPLIEAGVVGHWTDLGEPEMFDPNAWYAGLTGDYAPLNRQADVHNLYNLLWSESIFDGYQRNGVTQRPFILSRSGAPGSQRYGVAMWSGDIGSNLSSLASHLNVQMQMSFSGMDYFGSDIGGFHRGGLDGDLDEMYTRWFAISSLIDLPVRAHTENLCNCKETAPDRIGDLPSNLANIRLRYALSPYLYSLSQRAYLAGEPVFPPLVYYYQADPQVRELGDHKLLGRDLLAAFSTTYGEQARPVYLPEGTWYDFHTFERFTSKGETFGPFSLFPDGRYRLPLFARAGALVPLMYVDAETMELGGLRQDGSRRDELIVRVFSGEAGEFTLYEDDGVSLAYQDGEVRATLLAQQPLADGLQVTIGAAQGGYSGAPFERANQLELVVENAAALQSVSLNGADLPRLAGSDEWEAASQGWYLAGERLIRVKTIPLAVEQEKEFIFRW